VLTWRPQGIDPLSGGPEEFARHIETESKRWGGVAQAAGLKVSAMGRTGVDPWPGQRYHLYDRCYFLRFAPLRGEQGASAVELACGCIPR